MASGVANGTSSSSDAPLSRGTLDPHRRRSSGAKDELDVGPGGPQLLSSPTRGGKSVRLLALRIMRRFWRLAEIFVTKHHTSIVLTLLAIPFLVALWLSVTTSPHRAAPPTAARHLSPGDAANAFAKLQLSADQQFEDLNASSYIKLANRRGAKFARVSHDDVLNKIRVGSGTGARGVSLIVACMSRSKHFLLSLNTWVQVHGVTQIVAVDWTSSEDAASEMLAAFNNHGVPPSSVFVRVENQTHWVLSRAYNLAASFAVGGKILKVDCDTKLSPNILTALPMTSTIIHTGEGLLRGVWMADKSQFDKVGGYDGRLVHYGYEYQDLYDRMVQTPPQMEPRYFPRDMLTHASFIETDGNPPVLLPEVWIASNKLVLDSLSPWDARLAQGDTFDLWEPPVPSQIYHIFAEPVSTSQSALSMIPSDRKHQLLRKATQQVLHDIHHIPWDCVNQLSDSEAVDTLRYLAIHESKPLIVLLTGHFADRLAVLIWAMSVGIYLERPILVSWIPGPETQAEIRNILDFARVNKAASNAGLNLTLIPISEWKCQKQLSECEGFDSAYRLIQKKSLDDISGIPNANSAKVVLYHTTKYIRPNILTSIEDKIIKKEAAKALLAGMSPGVIQTMKTDGQELPSFAQVTGIVGFVRPDEVQQMLGAYPVPPVTRTTSMKQLVYIAATNSTVDKELRKGILGKGRVEQSINCPGTAPRTACSQAAVGAVLKLAQCARIWPTTNWKEGFLSRPGVASALELHEVMKPT